MTVEEGIADGIDEVRKAVRYQITHGAKLIKCCASGGVMTPTGPPGAQQYSDRGARRDRRRGPPSRPPGRHPLPTATRRSTPRIDAGIDCIEHGMMIGDDTDPAAGRHRHLPRLHRAPSPRTGTSPTSPKSLQAKAAEVFPKAKESLSKAIEAGVKVALGTDAPAIFHGRNAEELDVLVKRGMTPDPGHPRRDDRRRRPHRHAPTSAASPPRCSPTSSASPATRSPTSRRSSGCPSS